MIMSLFKYKEDNTISYFLVWLGYL